MYTNLSLPFYLNHINGIAGFILGEELNKKNKTISIVLTKENIDDFIKNYKNLFEEGSINNDK